jgi:hypothetical protein
MNDATTDASRRAIYEEACRAVSTPPGESDWIEAPPESFCAHAMRHAITWLCVAIAVLGFLVLGSRLDAPPLPVYGVIGK